MEDKKRTTFSSLTESSQKTRYIFISASYLSREYRKIPVQILKDSIFFFGSNRSWLFPKTEEEKQESMLQPTDYLNFEKDFLDLILQKESEGMVYFLKPEKNFEKVSQFLQTITDPVTGKPYKPLILDPEWWKKEFKHSKYSTTGSRVVSNFQKGDHDYSPTMELLYQSNPTLIPVLTFLH